MTTPSSRPISSAGGTELDDLFATYDALAVGDLIRTRKLGAREVLDATMASLRKANQRLNAVTDLYEDARPPADGPLQGVPYVIKQLMADCAGYPTTLGSKFFAKQPVAASDSAAVARMRRAGLVIVGRTNTSEFGLALGQVASACLGSVGSLSLTPAGRGDQPFRLTPRPRQDDAPGPEEHP